MNLVLIMIVLKRFIGCIVLQEYFGKLFAQNYLTLASGHLSAHPPTQAPYT